MNVKLSLFLNESCALIVDASSAMRKSAEEALLALGLEPSQVITATSIDNALKIIENKKPKLIISQYKIKEKSGFQLSKRQSLLHPKNQRMFLISTENAGELVVAQGIDEDISGYLLKPFTIQSLKDYLVERLQLTINEPDYAKKIREARKCIENKEYMSAVPLLTAALKDNPRPALAYYYLGQVQFKQSNLKEAVGFYMKGLKVNKCHYSCLSGAAEVFKELGHFDKVFQIIDRISGMFPLSSERLQEAFEIISSLEKYESFAKYYQFYLDHEERPSSLVSTVGNVCLEIGLARIKENKEKEGIEASLKAISLLESVTDIQPIIFQISDELVENNFFTSMQSFFDRWPQELIETPVYYEYRYKVINGIEKDHMSALEKGRQLLKKTEGTAGLYEMIIERAKQCEQGTIVENLALKAIQKWPGRKEDFQKFLPQ